MVSMVPFSHKILKPIPASQEQRCSAGYSLDPSHLTGGAEGRERQIIDHRRWHVIFTETSEAGHSARTLGAMSQGVGGFPGWKVQKQREAK